MGLIANNVVDYHRYEYTVLSNVLIYCIIDTRGLTVGIMLSEFYKNTNKPDISIPFPQADIHLDKAQPKKSG